jgi:hypothetical protein
MPPNVYVDGPNLYYAALRNRPVRWLDLSSWCAALLSDQQVQRVRYFTAWARVRPATATRSPGSRSTYAP